MRINYGPYPDPNSRPPIPDRDGSLSHLHSRREACSPLLAPLSSGYKNETLSRNKNLDPTLILAISRNEEILKTLSILEGKKISEPFAVEVEVEEIINLYAASSPRSKYPAPEVPLKSQSRYQTSKALLESQRTYPAPEVPLKSENRPTRGQSALSAFIGYVMTWEGEASPSRLERKLDLA